MIPKIKPLSIILRHEQLIIHTRVSREFDIAGYVHEGVEHRVENYCELPNRPSMNKTNIDISL